VKKRTYRFKVYHGAGAASQTYFKVFKCKKRLNILNYSKCIKYILCSINLNILILDMMLKIERHDFIIEVKEWELKYKIGLSYIISRLIPNKDFRKVFIKKVNHLIFFKFPLVSFGFGVMYKSTIIDI